MKNVEEEYKSIGYRDAKVVSDTVITVDPNTLEIVVTIEEGKPYYLGDITFTGNSVFHRSFRKSICLSKGDRYDAVGINKRISGSEKDDDLQTLYMDQGYLFANLIPIEKMFKTIQLI